MSLKKTDKIIAIIGVLILVIAGIGIFLYVGTEETPSSAPSTEEKIFEVKWVMDTGTMSIDGSAEKKNDYTTPFDVIEKQGSVITEVVVSFNWEDDHTSGIILRKGIIKRGVDTLTAEITLGGEVQTHESEGYADNTTNPLTFTITSAPQDEEITDVISESEAWDIINSEYANKDKASFQTKITVTPGEKIGIRPLKLLRFLRDKGNDFTMEITYTYYTPSINEFTIEPPPVESGYTGTQQYHYTNYPGKQ